MQTVAMCLLLGACSSGGGGTDEILPPSEPEPEKPLPIALDCSSTGYAVARATDDGFEAGDAVGVFVVNYDQGQAGALQPSGNHVHNMRFSYGGSWTPDEPIYWSDNRTKADFYVYYPYRQTVSVHDLTVDVPADQSTPAGYKSGYFLWGKAVGVSPTNRAVSVTVNHVLSQAHILVKPGNGFTEESLAAADVTVTLNGLQTRASVDLATGKVVANGKPQALRPLKEQAGYKALVVPQTVAVEGLVTITVDGKDYNLTQGEQPSEITFRSGYRHTFTITVNKTSNGINVGIGSWEDDGVDHGGVAE